MFSKLFISPRTIARYRDGPLADDRTRYLVECASAGFQTYSLRMIATHQLRLVELLGLRMREPVSMLQIEAAADEWSRSGGHHRTRPATTLARTRFLGHAVRWLRFAGLLEESAPVGHAHTAEAAAFAEWMREERGWSAEHIRACSGTVDRFFRSLDGQAVPLRSVTICHVDQEIARCQARGCNRVTVRDYAERLRVFFRFAEERGWCTAGLADGILPTRSHPGETIPKGLQQDEVVRLLATTEGDRPADIRDRAVLLLLITYGLRAGEVSGLELDNLDWVQETLRVRCPKPGRTHLYPLSRRVGQAIVRYLREVRPPRPERALFLTMCAPLRRMSGCAVSYVVGSRLTRIGVTGKRMGAHSLRHATAQRLLDRGLSMKQVGDYLGHRSVESTSAYAKVQLSALREVAAIDLEGLA